jgi:oligoribonuclease NrnB/cAMP/cGMP phosphodiesterase (DHH superfamily)
MSIRRIIVHADFDGLVCALLLQEVLGIEDVLFAQPSDLRDGTLPTHSYDAVADLPFPPGGCGLWFDHHASSTPQQGPAFHLDTTAPSCARLIYRTHEHQLRQFAPLVAAADTFDTAAFHEHELASHTPAIVLGLSLFGAHEQYLIHVLQLLRQHPLETVASSILVQEHYHKVMEHEALLLSLLDDRMQKRGKVLVLDFGDVDVQSRFFLFSLYSQHPEIASSVFISRHDDARLRVSVGESIFTKTNSVDIGALMRGYGGGGHKQAGGCTIPAQNKSEIIDALVVTLNN